jgi:diguanylate cyclase (GGDEF)-like protein
MRLSRRLATPSAIRVLLVLGATGVLLHLVSITTGIATGFTGRYLHGATILVAIVVTAMRAHRGPERDVWSSLTAGLTLWFAGEVYWLSVEPEGVSLSDVGYLGAYPFFWAAMIRLIRSRLPQLETEMWLDGLTAALTVAAVGATIVYDAIGAGSDERGLALVIELAYPLADVSLVAIAVAAAAASGALRDRSFAVLAAGFAVFALSDAVYLTQIAQDAYIFGGALDIGWTVGMLIMALAAWQPARRLEPVQGGQRLLLPVVMATVSIGLLAVDHWPRIDVLSVALACLALVMVLARLVVTFGQKQRAIAESREQALTDALTGLGNRRRLHADLERASAESRALRLVIFDLNGFKAYNDAFGHPAGDELLHRLGVRLGTALAGIADAYRLGGDEFCLLADAHDGERALEIGEAALSESGGDFRVSAAWGAATLGEDTDDPVRAMTLADQRMYEGKRGRMPVQRQVRAALLAALRHRRPELEACGADTAGLARAVAQRLGMSYDDIEDVAHAAELHDIGRLATPDAILDKPGTLSRHEWHAIQAQPVVGEEILRAAPAMQRVADIVRSTHERYDGAGYPDGLQGDLIPLGARIIAVVDAFDAITRQAGGDGSRWADRALAELRRCAGTQFDPAVVDVTERVIRDRLRGRASAIAA